MTPKKIIIVGPAYPLRGGIANFNEALAKAFVKENHNVILYSYYYQYPNFLFPGKTQYDNTAEAPVGLNIESTLSSINPLSWKKTAKKIINEKPDLAVFRFWLPFMGPSLGTVAKKLKSKGIKLVAITDNVIPHESRIGDRQLTKYFLKQCDGFVTLSKSVMDDIGGFVTNPNKITLAHPLYDTFGEKVSRQEGLNKLGLEDSGKYLLFFGLIRGYKGLDLALKAMASSGVVKLGVKLIVAGEFYDKKDKYDQLIEDLRIKGQIIIHDRFIPEEEVKYFFAATDAVVQPYKTATQSGITQVAYNFDQPMIVTNVGGLPEIVPHNKVGFVVEKDAQELGDAIVSLYENDNIDRFSKAVKEEKKKFEWSHFVNELLSFSTSL